MNLKSISKEYTIQYGNLKKPELQYRDNGIVYLLFGEVVFPIGRHGVGGVTLFLREEQIAWILISQSDTERALSPYWKYEDWDTLEAEEG